jgi:class 3 adenylate cyclase
MKDRINKTSICSVVFIDIIDYSKKSVSDQITEKESFNALLTEAIKDVAQNDRIIIDTGDGAAIALLGAPEEALFVSLTIRDGILRKNKENGHDLLVRIGINLGPVRVVSDINGMPNIIGDGINVAQRVMSFAEPNQILVSRSYYEITSRLTQEITDMFAYSGVKQDKHVREHEVYVIKPTREEGAVTEAPPSLDESVAVSSKEISLKQRYIFAAAIMLLIGVVIAGVLLPGFLFAPDKASEHIAGSSNTTVGDNKIEPAGALPKAEAPAASGNKVDEAKPVLDKPRPEKTGSEKPVTQAAKTAEKKPVVKKAKPKDVDVTPIKSEPVPAPQAPAPTAESKPSERSGWDAFTHSIKQGSETKACSDGERALNQCR